MSLAMRIRQLLPLAVYLIALNLLVRANAQARTWNILEDGSGDAPTVQAGIDSAAAGDTVLVGPGTFHEAINFLGKGIILRSLSGVTVTILDATGLDTRVVTFNSGESRTAVLTGFTITGGAGGIIVLNSQPSIIGNVITGNGPSGEHDPYPQRRSVRLDQAVQPYEDF